MIAVQFPLPGGWANNYLSRRDPHDRLAALRDDVLDAKADIRLALERLAEKHDIALKEVTQAMISVDDGLSDLVYDVERELEHEIAEDQTP